MLLNEIIKTFTPNNGLNTQTLVIHSLHILNTEANGDKLHDTK